MSPENRETPLHPHLFPHQISAFNVLLARAQTYFSGHWRSLPIKTRWHSLLVGPTGTGKTALARMVADATDAAIFQIGAANWMPSGAHDRATSQTLPLLLKHIARHERTVLFIDEVDKVHVHAVDSPWLNFIKQELLEIYDGRWNIGLKSDDDDETLDTEHISGNKLRTATFIVSAGTFQDYYDDRPRVAVGFHRSQPSLPRPSLSSDEIAKWPHVNSSTDITRNSFVCPNSSLNNTTNLPGRPKNRCPGGLFPAFEKPHKPVSNRRSLRSRGAATSRNPWRRPSWLLRPK